MFFRLAGGWDWREEGRTSAGLDEVAGIVCWGWIERLGVEWQWGQGDLEIAPPWGVWPKDVG